MRFKADSNRVKAVRDEKIFGHFIEHFHRQIYGGVYDPGNSLSDKDGLREDVLEAMRNIHVPILRWPGGCFVSSYNWKKGVGENRVPVFDKAWRVEEPNTFGTDEYIALCRKIGCEPYICTNAGTANAEEMSDWVEYCNLSDEGEWARLRALNGHPSAYGVRYWSIGNENYGHWEIGAKTAEEWGPLVRESAKMMKHVDPSIELSAAALTDVDWNVSLLKYAGKYLDWISIHEYWDHLAETNACSPYDKVMEYTEDVGHSIRKIRGLLEAFGLEKNIRIAFDEWNVRGWYHPNVHTIRQGLTKEEYLYPRDRNDDNTHYTMADAVFSACFLNELLRNADIVGMAAFAPIVNTRGCIFTYDKGIVLRSTYHVFDLYTNRLGEEVLDAWSPDPDPAIDAVATAFAGKKRWAVAAVNKDSSSMRKIAVDLDVVGDVKMAWISGSSPDSFNDIGRNDVKIMEKGYGRFSKGMEFSLPAHSVCIIEIAER